MAQTPSRFCQQCGMPLAAGQRFCSNCGATMDVNMAHPTERASESGASTILPQNMQGEPAFMPGGQNPGPLMPPPPPPSSLTPAPSSYYTQYAPPAQGSQQGAVGPAPVYAKPQKDSSKGVLGQIGCGVLLVILLIVGLCGGAGYLGYHWIASQANSTTGTNTGSTTSTNNGNGNNSTPTGQVTTKQINQTITYASDTITILSVQHASSFSDDSATSNGIVRINVKENNATTGLSFPYYDTLRLILPDKSSVAPGSTKTGSSPQAQTTQENWWDFPAATNLSIDQMSLQFGSPDQAQMLVPLTGHADISQYQTKTTNPNAKTQYYGLTWTITNASVGFSAVGRQAPSGMRYVSVAMTVDNNSSQYFTAYWGDYFRLKTGSNTSAPTTDSNFPTSFPAGSTGHTGTLIFLVPQGSTSFTLIMLANANANPPVSQATIDFQVA